MTKLLDKTQLTTFLSTPGDSVRELEHLPPLVDACNNVLFLHDSITLLRELVNDGRVLNQII